MCFCTECNPGYRLRDRSDRQMQFTCKTGDDGHLHWESDDGGEAFCIGMFSVWPEML